MIEKTQKQQREEFIKLVTPVIKSCYELLTNKKE